MKQLLKGRQPDFLKRSDKVWVVSASSKATEGAVNNGIEILQSWKLRTELGKSVLSSFGSLAGKDEDRLFDLQLALDDPDAKAIFFSRGGYGVTRILDHLNWEGFLKNPKWLVGFSDLTALHLACLQIGISSIHGPNLVQFSNPMTRASTMDIMEMLFGQKPTRNFSIQFAGNRDITDSISGPMVGGNLTLLAHSLGSRFELSCQDSLLFMEEIGEGQYKVDRLLLQLFRAGHLTKAKAILLGQFTHCEPGDFPFSVLESVQNLVGDKVPVFFGFPMGHEDLSFGFIHGQTAKVYLREDHWFWEQTIQSQT